MKLLYITSYCTSCADKKKSLIIPFHRFFFQVHLKTYTQKQIHWNVNIKIQCQTFTNRHWSSPKFPIYPLSKTMMHIANKFKLNTSISTNK